MSCQTCEQLREEIAFLKGVRHEAEVQTAWAKVRAELGLTPRAAEILAKLYEAKGRIVATWVLGECLEAETDSTNAVSVYVTRLRHVFGKGGLINDWGRGYRLSADAVATIADMLGEAA